MDLESEKVKRDARIQAKRERISAEANTPAPETTEVVEEVPTEDTSKKVKEETPKSKRPEKQVE